MGGLTGNSGFTSSRSAFSTFSRNYDPLQDQTQLGIGLYLLSSRNKNNERNKNKLRKISTINKSSSKSGRKSPPIGS